MRDYDDDEMMYDDDEDNSEHPFAFAQGGIMGIPLSDFIKNFKKSESAGLSASMFDNEWLLQFSSDVIENNNEIAIIHAEVIPHPNRKTNRHDILEVCEFLKKSHFLRFAVAYFYNESFWTNESVDMRADISYITKKNPQKISIVINYYPIPEYYLNSNLVDTYRSVEKESILINKKDNISLNLSVLKLKSLYEPLTTLDMTLSFGIRSKINFDNINIFVLYTSVIEAYINNICDDYYRHVFNASELLKYTGVSVLDARYVIHCTKDVMSITVQLSPNILAINETLYAFQYLGNSQCALKRYISHDLIPINDGKFNLSMGMTSFLNNSFSSPVSQSIFINTIPLGYTALFDSSKWIINRIESVTLIVNRTINNLEKLKKVSFNNEKMLEPIITCESNQVIKNDNSFSIIVPENDISIPMHTPDNRMVEMKIQLCIDIPISAAIYEDLNNEFISNLIKDYVSDSLYQTIKNDKIYSSILYQDEDVLRIGIYDMIETDQTDLQKRIRTKTKKRKIFESFYNPNKEG